MTTQDNTIDTPTRVSDLGKAVAVIERGGHSLAIPENLNQQIEFAKVMSMGGAMIGKPFRNNPGACLGICNQAWQWGMNPFSVSQKAYLVNEIIAFEAQLVHAVVLKLAPLAKRPRFTYEGEGDARRCTVTFWVKGEDEPLTYTSPPFGKITPKNSPLWKTDPDQQQAYYTIRAGARRYFPEVLMGVLDHEEAVEIMRVEGEKTKPITLGGDTDNVVEAEFSDGTAVLTKNAEKKKDKAAKADRKKAAPEGGLEVSDGVAPQDAAATDKPAAPPANEPKPEAASDLGFCQDIATQLKGMKTGKADLIREHRKRLETIRAESDDEAAQGEAHRLLNLYELD